MYLDYLVFHTIPYTYFKYICVKYMSISHDFETFGHLLILKVGLP